MTQVHDVMRALFAAIWLEAMYQQRRALARYQHLQIPAYEGRADYLRLLRANPYPIKALV